MMRDPPTSKPLKKHPRTAPTNSRLSTFMRLFTQLLALLILSKIALADEDPGFPNVNYASTDEGKALSLTDPGKAISGVNMHRGLLFVPMGRDGGGLGAGAFALYDISDPTNPQVHFDSRDHMSVYHDSSTMDYVGDWGELHHIPMSGNLVLVSEHRKFSGGYSIVDLSPLYDNPNDPLPRTVSRYSYPGVTSPTGYDGYSFAPGWQGTKYLYAPTGTNGLMIVDTSDFDNPQLLANIPRSQLANLTIRSGVPIGNLLILSTVSIGGRFTCLLMDISDPVNPQLINSFTGPVGYQGFTYGSKFYGGGQPLIEHDFTDPHNIVTTTLASGASLDRPEYGFGKDNNLFIGHYPGLTKWSLDGTNTTQVQKIDSGIIDDHAFITPLGNLAVVTSDHANDRKLIIGVHDQNADNTPPAVNFISPADGETNANPKSRVGLSFTDFIDHMTVDTSSLIIRDFGTKTTVPGTYSTMFGIVNFVPENDLAVNTTYEVVLTAGGVSDQAGNAIPTETLVATFSTGSQVDTYVATVVPDSPREAGVPATISLSLLNPEGFTLEHSFNFGDGSPATPFSSSLTANHTFNSVANHVVTVSTRIVGQTNSTLATGVQTIHHPLPSEGPSQSSNITFDPENNLVWNVNPDNNSITAINPTTQSVVHETPVGTDPKSLALGPDNTLWVCNKQDATVSVINRSTGAVTTTHPLPTNSTPHGIVIDRTAQTAYVSLEATGQIAKINTSSGAIQATLSVGPWPRHLGFDPSRNELWVTRFISSDTHGEVFRINTSTFQSKTSCSLSTVMEPDSLSNGRGLPNYLGAIALSPDLTQAFVPAKKDNIFRGTLRDGQNLTFEHTVRSMASRINLNTGQEDPAARRDFDNSDFANAVAFSPNGNLMFFTTSGSATIWVVDAYDPQANPFTLASGGLAPDGLTLSPDGSQLFVHNFMSRTVTIFNVAAVCASVCGTSPLVATVPTVTSENLTPNVLRGKQLFYDSSDPRLSQDTYMSCASCHLDGGHDGRTWDFTQYGVGLYWTRRRTT